MGLNSSYNPIIGFPRYTPDFTFGGGSYETAYPATNAGDVTFARVARTTDATEVNTVLTGTSSTAKGVRLFGIAAHNLSLNATYRLRLYTDVAMTDLVYDSSTGQAIWPAVYNYSGRNWFTPYFWSGQYGSEEIEGQIPFLPIILPQQYNIKAFRFDFSDTSNPDGYIEIGLLEVSAAWQPTVGIAYGSQYGYEFFDEITQLDGGLERTFNQEPSYVFDGSIPALPESEVFNQAMELYRRYRVNTPFIFVQFPTRPVTWLKSAKMVKLAGAGLMSHVHRLHDSVPLSLREYKG